MNRKMEATIFSCAEGNHLTDSLHIQFALSTPRRGESIYFIGYSFVYKTDRQYVLNVYMYFHSGNLFVFVFLESL